MPVTQQRIMAILNYSKRLSNLQSRRYDRELNESIISKSFSTSGLPDNIKYFLESMKPIDKKYNDRTILAADRIMKHLEDGFGLHFGRAYRKQGSVPTRTNIKAHSDIDLLTIIDRYVYQDPSRPNTNPYTFSSPPDDIKLLRKQALEILRDIYDEVDDSNEKCITVFNKALWRKIDVVFCFWYNTEEYERTSNEYYRGIKFKASSLTPDYPFAHLYQVNQKGDATMDGARRAIRLLKTLKADSDNDLELLKGFQLTSVIHSMDNNLLYYRPGKDIDIAQAVSGHLNVIINNPDYRTSIQSPNGCEKPFGDSMIVKDLRLLKEDLDTLIEDASKEIRGSWSVKNALVTY
ncbi:hypothetical protein [Chitinophaga defluvii]|uniref:Nucleotidyltransferase n=1 Tax=Chitinophaga defluvii TaxID=3163343 RepID=A0ABV2T030_9BACT